VVLGKYHDGNIFLAKFSTEGTLIWDLTWGGNQGGASAVAIAPDGMIYVTGATFDFGVGQGDAFLLSFTSTGTLNWQRTWGGDGFDVPRGVAVATDGNIYITGDTGNSAFLVKFSPDGTVGVQREWGVVGKTGIPNDDQTFGNGVAAAPDGGAFVVGDTSGTGFNPNLVAAPFDSGGNFVWLRVGGPGFGSTQDVAVAADGSLHITGNVVTEPSTADAFVWNVLANGKGHDAAVWVVAIRSRANAVCRSPAVRVARSSLRDLPAHLRTRSVVDRRTQRRQTGSSPRLQAPSPYLLESWE